ncbi:hypothetical protein I656_02324 [Geobacillus sp. WSUCF1]|nr:hypothetical protein I656_02324 [Geobacillus sp. WSUCF1]
MLKTAKLLDRPFHIITSRQRIKLYVSFLVLSMFFLYNHSFLGKERHTPIMSKCHSEHARSARGHRKTVDRFVSFAVLTACCR